MKKISIFYLNQKNIYLIGTLVIILFLFLIIGLIALKKSKILQTRAIENASLNLNTTSWSKAGLGNTNYSFTTGIHSVKAATIGQGISKLILIPKSQPYVFEANIKVEQGVANLKIGNKELVISTNTTSPTILLFNQNELKNQTTLTITAKENNSSFSISQVLLRPLNMAIGSMINESSRLQKNIGVNDKQVISNKMIVQKIPVIIGMSMQVVANHCDTEPINSKTLLCQTVIDLAKQDLSDLNERFKGTGKSFDLLKNNQFPEGFDQPWDSSSNQGCGWAAGGQSKPKNSCNNPTNAVYIAIHYVKDVNESGGDTNDKNFVEYVAPSKYDGHDYWKERSNVAWVIAHEFGHGFGQIHTPWVPQGYDNLTLKNNVIPNIDYPLYFDSDIGTIMKDEEGKKKQLWAFQIAQKGKYGNDNIINNAIPDNVKLNLLLKGGMKLRENSEIYIYKSKNLTNSLDDIFCWGSDCFIGKKMDDYVLLSKDKIKNTSLFFIVAKEFEGNGEKRIYTKTYYSWLSVMEINLSYFNGHTTEAEFTKEMIEVNIEKQKFDFCNSFSGNNNQCKAIGKKVLNCQWYACSNKCLPYGTDKAIACSIPPTPTPTPIPTCYCNQLDIAQCITDKAKINGCVLKYNTCQRVDFSPNYSQCPPRYTDDCSKFRTVDLCNKAQCSWYSCSNKCFRPGTEIEIACSFPFDNVIVPSLIPSSTPNVR